MDLENKRVFIRGLSMIASHPRVNPRAKRAAFLCLLALTKNKHIFASGRKTCSIKPILP